VIRFRLNELLSDRSFKEGRRIEWQEVAEASGIHRTTLSRMLHVRGYNASVSNLDSLCRYFGCQLGELATYVPDAELDAPVQKSYRGPRPAAGRPHDEKPASRRPRASRPKGDKR
jgi:putative transcriptional regulator